MGPAVRVMVPTGITAGLGVPDPEVDGDMVPAQDVLHRVLPEASGMGLVLGRGQELAMDMGMVAVVLEVAVMGLELVRAAQVVVGLAAAVADRVLDMAITHRQFLPVESSMVKMSGHVELGYFCYGL